MLNLGTTKLALAKPAEIFDRFVPDGLSHAATSFVESLKINSSVLRGYLRRQR